jgi:hypothetical protein
VLSIPDRYTAMDRTVVGNVQNAVALISCLKCFIQVTDMKSLGNKDGGAHCHLTKRLVSFWAILDILFNFDDN